MGRLALESGSAGDGESTPDPGDLESLLRIDYPDCVVRPRLDFTEVGVDREATWYAYRDGGATPRQLAGQGAPMMDSG